ncbi:unnamed protein product, partial [Mesorhabditis spiculigera]
MSRTLLKEFIEDVECGDDGKRRLSSSKSKKMTKQQQRAKMILAAAKRGQVSLPETESYLIDDLPSTSLNTKLANQGFSLLEQARADRPTDLAARNMRYIKHVRKNAVDPKKGNFVHAMMTGPESRATIVRQERAKITGLREPKKDKKQKEASGSVFSDKDFDVLKRKKLAAMDDNEEW